VLAGVALGTAAAFVGARRAQSAAATPVPLTRFRTAGDRTDTPALQRALAAGSPIRLVAGMGLGPAGAYVVDGAFLKPSAWIEGDGAASVMMPDPRGSGICLIFDGRSYPGAVAGIRLRSFRMSGLQRQKGFSEHVHLVNLNDARSVRIENMTFEAWQGDAVYFGSGWPGGGEGHNSDVTIQNCTFDGLVRQCRNAISVTSGSGIRIEGCTFVNCTRDDMPGPVDFELNKPGRDRLSDIVVTGCRFTDCGGTSGEISFIAGRGARNASGRFEVSNNEFARYRGTGAEIHVELQGETTGRSAPVEVSIVGNRGSGGNRPLALKAGKRITSSGNTWTNYRQPAIVGTARGDTVGLVIFADRFEFPEKPRGPGAAVDLYDADTVDLTGSTFEGCDTGGAPVKMTDGLTQKLVLSSDSFAQCTAHAQNMVEQEKSHRLASLFIDGRPAKLSAVTR
jgi:hypothetical protein